MYMILGSLHMWYKFIIIWLLFINIHF